MLANRLTMAGLILWTGGLCVAAESQKVSGSVVDWQARAVEGAEVAIYERIHDHSTDRDTALLRDEIRRTDKNGRFVLTTDVTPSYRVFVVARKQGLALGWDSVSQSDDNLIVLEKPCALAGVVADAAGKPVAGAKVRAVPKSTYLTRLEQTPILAPESWFTTQTDNRGQFRFDCFSADVNTDFWVEAPGRELTYVYSTHYMTACGYEAGRTDIKLTLPAESSVRGRVVEAAGGKPVDRAHVLLDPKDPAPQANPFLPQSTTSGKDGEFVFRGVPHGRRYVNVSPPAATGLIDRRMTFDVKDDEAGNEIVVSLEKGGTIEVVAREEVTGKPIAKLPVYFWEAIQSERSSFYKDVVTDVNGQVRFSAPVGECKLSTRLEGYSPFSYGDQVLVTEGQIAKAQITLNRDPAIQGLVVDEAGQPVSGAAVYATLTDRAGRFEVRRSPDSLSEKWIVRHVVRNLAAVDEVGSNNASTRITLKPALTIAGQITDPNGEGIPAARIALDIVMRARTGGNVASAYGHEFPADSQGRYEVKAVAPEETGFEYRMSVNASGYGAKQLQRISIHAEPGSQVKLDPIVLQPADQSVTGIVVDANDNAISGMPIIMHNANQPTRYTVTDPNGRFVIRRVCKGPLRIQASFESNAGVLRAEGGDQDVKIVLGQDNVHLRYAVLKGKPLPGVESFGLSLSQVRSEERAILVCFFDLQQRPSRNAIMQLAKQVEGLTQKGITLVGVQTAKADRTELDKWAKDNNVSFPLGSAGADEEKVRIAWGVKSLPWLILTDRAHVVTAEGITVTELTKP